ncbi:transmembrane protein 71 [Rhinatrema bivittatum]|uniref:transmembrane protein 71 n=1 Tax=Rhinatrema bivittatum TaxID=194408 RepID=UPI00112B53C2|nr:transmembrane protein 71 [Rhinatrema bivittatum]
MYQLSTPLERKYPSWFGRNAGCVTPPSEHYFSSFDLPGDNSPESPQTGSPLAYRRSPRLLANGYYIVNEDSFLLDNQGNMTLNPSHSVSYKENLVRIFRKKKRLRCSLASLFNLSSSHAWLQTKVLENPDSPMSQTEGEDGDLESDSDDECDISESSSEQKDFTSGSGTPVSNECLAPPIQLKKKFHCSSPESHIRIQNIPVVKENDFLSETQPAILCDALPTMRPKIRVRCSSPVSFIRVQKFVSRERAPETNILWNPVIILFLCLVLSICARCVLGGLFISWLAFFLVITLTCAIKPSFHSLFKHFKLRI